MDSAIKEKVLAVAGSGRNAAEWTAYFRVTLGLYYLAGLMTSETIDFKKVDRAFNQFIYHTIGKGHTITSVLQFMSGAKVVPVVSSPRFIAAFAAHCPDVPSDTIPFLLQLNLGVAKNISGIDVGGPLLDWIEAQAALAAGQATAAGGTVSEAIAGQDAAPAGAAPADEGASVVEEGAPVVEEGAPAVEEGALVVEEGAPRAGGRSGPDVL